MKKVYFMWWIKSLECFLKKLENLLARNFSENFSVKIFSQKDRRLQKMKK